MPQPTQATSEEGVPEARICFHTVNEIATWAASLRTVPGEEWLLTLLLDAHYCLLGVYDMYQGPRCTIDSCLDITTILTEAIRHRASNLIFLCYHNHAWTPKPTDSQQLLTFWQETTEAGIPLRMHITLDSTGLVYPLRLRQFTGSGSGTMGAWRDTSVLI